MYHDRFPQWRTQARTAFVDNSLTLSSVVIFFFFLLYSLPFLKFLLLFSLTLLSGTLSNFFPPHVLLQTHLFLYVTNHFLENGKAVIPKYTHLI